MSDSVAPTSTLVDGHDGRFVCVVLHDVAPSTRSACLRTLRAVATVATVPVTLLAVPRFHGDMPGAEFEAWLGQRSAAGDEMALHGWTHRDELPSQGFVDSLRRRHYTRSEGEFWALPETEATRRIDAGIEWFRRNSWPLHGFVAPAWLLGPGARAALDKQRFEWTATLRQLVHLRGSGPAESDTVDSQSVVYSTSSGWRRQLSLVWNTGVAIAERRNRILRIELHPRDADFTDIRRSWQRILARALVDREPVTVSDFMRRARVESAAGAPTTTLWQSTSAD